MPADLRLATLVNRRFDLDSRAFPLQGAQVEALDNLCRTLGVPALSQFIDLTALELREASELLDEEPGQVPEPDPLTGLDWGIEDTAWYPSAAGLTCLEALIGHLQRNASAAAGVQRAGEVTTALQHWRCLLEPLEPEGGQFHLSAG